MINNINEKKISEVLIALGLAVLTYNLLID